MNVRSAYARIFPIMTDDLLWRNVSKVLLRKKAFQVLKILTKEQVSASASPFFHPDLDTVASAVGISRRHLLRLINFLEKDGWVFTKKERRRPLLLSANFIKLWQYVSKKLLQDDATMKLLGTTIKFLDQKRNQKIKLSIEGAIMVGKNAKKNIVVVGEEEAVKFVQGYDVKAEKLIEAEINNFVLVRYGNDIIGVGILREGCIENLVPKARRLVKIDETEE